LEQQREGKRNERLREASPVKVPKNLTSQTLRRGRRNGRGGWDGVS